MEEKEEEDAGKNDQTDAIFGLEENGTGAKRKHAVDKMFERFSKKGNVEFGFGESGPMCMGTDSGLAAIVHLAISECKFLGGDDDHVDDESVGGLRMGPRDPSGCRDTERSAREMMRRSCMVEVLAWTDEEGRAGGGKENFLSRKYKVHHRDCTVRRTGMFFSTGILEAKVPVYRYDLHLK